MKIIVKTMSGSEYEFTQTEDGRIFFKKGVLLTGQVIRINNGPITIGKGINMDFYKENIYGKLENIDMFLNTTPVKDISVIL